MNREASGDGQRSVFCQSCCPCFFCGVYMDWEALEVGGQVSLVPIRCPRCRDEPCSMTKKMSLSMTISQ